jgi:hypothetical protein
MVNPPLLSQKITDRQPISDWAALHPTSDSKPTTPALHIPGAFPDTYPKSDVVQQDTQYKDTAINALHSAKEYMTTSAGGVKHLMENTGDKVGGYLPQSVNAYLR